MSIQFRCHHCNKRVQAPDSAGGKKARCPSCGQTVEVPIVKADDEDVNTISGFADFEATRRSQAGSLPKTPPHSTSSFTGDELPASLIAPRRTLQPKRTVRTRMQVVTLGCGIALAALYVLFGLLAVAMLTMSGPSSKSPGAGDAIGIFIFMPPSILAGFILYFAPSLIAYIREHQNAVPIFIINAVFGWLLIGWVAGMAWAFSSDVRESRQYIRQVVVKESADVV